MIDREKLDPEIKKLFDGVLISVKFARWAYEAALKEGFTSNQSMQIATSYMQSLMNTANNISKNS